MYIKTGRLCVVTIKKVMVSISQIAGYGGCVVIEVIRRSICF